MQRGQWPIHDVIDKATSNGRCAFDASELNGCPVVYARTNWRRTPPGVRRHVHELWLCPVSYEYTGGGLPSCQRRRNKRKSYIEDIGLGCQKAHHCQQMNIKEEIAKGCGNMHHKLQRHSHVPDMDSQIIQRSRQRYADIERHGQNTQHNRDHQYGEKAARNRLNSSCTKHR